MPYDPRSMPHPQHVWLIDDIEGDHLLVTEALAGEGLTYRSFAHACDAVSALTAADANHLPDLLMLDVFMPGIGIYAILRLIQAEPRLAALRICVLSGVDVSVSHPLLTMLGADCVLRKPATFAGLARLRDEVRAVMAGAGPTPLPASAG